MCRLTCLKSMVVMKFEIFLSMDKLCSASVNRTCCCSIVVLPAKQWEDQTAFQPAAQHWSLPWRRMNPSAQRSAAVHHPAHAERVGWKETEVTRTVPKPPVWDPASAPPPLTYLQVVTGTALGLHQEALRASPSCFLQAARPLVSIETKNLAFLIF